MVSALISRLVVLFLGTLYPVYGSYKAIRSRNPKEYIRWMMYWICFALFSFFETFSDIFLAFCVPFYYELKILFLVWLLCPTTNGSVILYKNFVHPRLLKHEQEIDEMIAKTKENGVMAMYRLGSKGAQYASQLLATTAIKGQQVILEQLQRSYSQGDVTTRAVTETEWNEEVQRSRQTNRRKEVRRQVVSAPTFSDDEDIEDIVHIDDIVEEDIVELPRPPVKKKGMSNHDRLSGQQQFYEDESSSENELRERMSVDESDASDDSDEPGTSQNRHEDDTDPDWRPLTRSKVVRKKPLAKNAEANNNKRRIRV